jgi:hypothetical protein
VAPLGGSKSTHDEPKVAVVETETETLKVA